MLQWVQASSFFHNFIFLNSASNIYSNEGLEQKYRIHPAKHR